MPHLKSIFNCFRPQGHREPDPTTAASSRARQHAGASLPASETLVPRRNAAEDGEAFRRHAALPPLADPAASSSAAGSMPSPPGSLASTGRGPTEGEALRRWSAAGSSLTLMRDLDAEVRGNGGVDLSFNWYRAEELLSGELHGHLLASVMADARSLSMQTGLAPADAAEVMRRAVCDGTVAAEDPIQFRNLLKFALYGVREKLTAEAELGEVMRRHPAFRDFPVQEAWRFCMDHDRWHEPGGADGLRFDNEAGYMGAMLRGLKQVLEDDLNHKGRVPTAAEFEELHDTAVAGVFTRHFPQGLKGDGPVTAAVVDALTAPRANYQQATIEAEEILRRRLPDQLSHFETGFRGVQGAHYELKPGWNLSKDGLAELQHAERNFKGWARMLTPGSGHARLASQWAEQSPLQWVCDFKTSTECKALADKVLRSHAKAMRGERSDDGKLRRIAETCRTLEQAHFFNDGNARTVGFLLLNRLLLGAGMSPALMSNPNEFDGFSIGELVQSIRQGQEKFARYAGALQS
jgi:hypothetical protein